MPYQLILTGDIKRQLGDLPGHIKTMARQQMAVLITDPRPPRSKELDGHVGHYRLWLGPKYRLVWYVREDEQAVEVEYIGPKSPELYKKLGLGRLQE
jgi:mRNA-degrading endonuclease RelE of RelBE toxin-antitoxin system